MESKIEKAREYMRSAYRPGGVQSSVHHGDHTRFDMAEKQAAREPIEIKNIIDYTNEFLNLLGMNPAVNPIMKSESLVEKYLYKNIQEANMLKDKRDIVWMKFTEDNYLGVVAVSNDINFDIPPTEKEYSQNYNTSGIIIHYLKKKWNNKFVLVFPLQNIPEELKRGDVEKGIGNYLIKKGVPILDYYSHLY